MSFIITGLPRSRTAWFAKFFTALGHPCHHELLAHSNSEDEFIIDLYLGGNADCGMAYYGEIALPTVIVHRPIIEVIDSLKQLYNKDMTKMLYALQKKLRTFKGLHVNFYDLDRQLESIVYYCTNTYPDSKIVEEFKQMTIEAEQCTPTSWAMQLLKENT